MLTVKEMKALEKFAHQQGVIYAQLMQNAGLQVFEFIKRKYDLDGKHAVVFCGQGNNGGDGFVVARMLQEHCPTVVLFFGEEEKLSEEAKENFDKLVGVTVIEIHDLKDLELFQVQEQHDLILVDALLGTGFSGEVREPVLSGVKLYNSLHGVKVSVDVPSGLNADTGEAKTCCAFDWIVTFHDLKTGMDGLQDRCEVVDIGIPEKKKDSNVANGSDVVIEKA